MDRAFGTRPIEQGFVRIGWRAVGDLSKIPADREAFKKAVAKVYPTMKAGAVPVIAGTLFKFAYEMVAGDRIIYPSKVDRKVNLGALVGEYQSTSSDDALDCPNFCKVKWLRNSVHLTDASTTAAGPQPECAIGQLSALSP